MTTLFQNLRFGWRMLAKNPGFAAVAVITLALGIGANTAIFSVVNTVLLQPLPYPKPSQLTQVWETNRYGNHIQVSGADFVDWKAQNESFKAMAAYDAGPIAVGGGTEPARVQVAGVSQVFFRMIGVPAYRGRWFLPQEHQPNQAFAILGYGLWQQNYGSNPKIIGHSIKIEGKDCTVVGIMPPGFSFPESAQLWYPLEFGGPIASAGDRSAHNFKVIARLKPGIELSAAQTEMRTIAARLRQEYPGSNKHISAAVISLRRQLEGNSRPVLLILLAAVGFVLLIASADVANLLLARATTRQKEMAVRTALGATRKRLLSQLLTESILLASIGGACGLLFAAWITALLTALAPSSVTRWGQIHVDGRVLAFAAFVSLLTGILCGIMPALHASRPDLNEALKESGMRGGSAQGQRRVRGALVISEIALAMVLLTGAGLLIRTFLNIHDVDLGFRTRDILTADISLPQLSPAYTNLHRVSAFYDQVLARVRAIPGVRSAATIDLPLLGDFHRDGNFAIAGEPSSGNLDASYRQISPEYFQTMGIPIIRGRDFGGEDTATSPGVVIINDAMARMLWPKQNPIGARIKFYGFGSPNMWMRVVGTVANVREFGPESEPDPTAYVPLSQHAYWALNGTHLVVRTTVPPSAVEAGVRAAVDSLDRTVPVAFSTMRQRAAGTIAGTRFRTFLLGSLALLALVLATVGIYGVMAYLVGERTREIGIRIALGAQKRDLLKLVMQSSVRSVLLGVGIGLAGAWTVTRVLASQLYGVKPTDPLTFAAVALILAGVGFVASYVPARRAMKVDPIQALRYE